MWMSTSSPSVLQNPATRAKLARFPALETKRGGVKCVWTCVRIVSVFLWHRSTDKNTTTNLKHLINTFSHLTSAERCNRQWILSGDDGRLLRWFQHRWRHHGCFKQKMTVLLMRTSNMFLFFIWNLNNRNRMSAAWRHQLTSEQLNSV